MEKSNLIDTAVRSIPMVLISYGVIAAGIYYLDGISIPLYQGRPYALTCFAIGVASGIVVLVLGRLWESE